MSNRPTPSDPLPIHVVIVSFNRAPDLRRCLASLERQSPAVARVTVVDNGSQDGSSEMVGQEFPWVSLLKLPYNGGACVPRNLGAADGREPVLWFLDSDAEIHGSNGAERLYAALTADCALAAIGGEAVLGTGGDIIGVKRLRISANAVVQGDTVASGGVSACHVIASCNLMVRRKDFLAIGGFDPFYSFFYEDIDLTWRLHSTGRRLAVLAPMPVVHHYSETIRFSGLWIHGRNRMYFCLRNLPWWRILSLPLADTGFLLRFDNLRRLLRRAGKPALAVSLVTETEAPSLTADAARRAAILALRMGMVLALGYLALPSVLLSALRARRQTVAPYPALVHGCAGSEAAS